MDAASAVVTVPASAITTSSTSNTVNVNQSNNILNTATSSSNSINNIGVNCNSSNSNSSCSSSSTSSISSGYGSTTTTPTNNYDIQQQQQQQQSTTPTTTPVPTTPIAIAEPIIPVATIAAVTPFYNEAITTHNLEVPHHHLQHSHTQQQQLQHTQHHLLPTNHHQFPQTHLQQQQQHHQYLSRQQYYSSYDYQQPAPTHNVTPAIAPGGYNMASYELNSPTTSYGSGQYKSANLSAAINYERSPGVVRTNTAVTNFNQQQQQQHPQSQTEQPPAKTINQQSPQFPGVLATSKQRSSSLIGNSSSTNTTKPQAAATPFYAQPLTQTHSNPTPFYDNLKHKMPLEYGHESYGNPSAATTASYHQQQKYYAAAKSQLKESSYGSPTGLNSKSLYPNTSNFFPGPGSYDKYGGMYPHASATGYTSAGHMGNETPPEVGNYRKPVVVNSMQSPSWPWGIDYASGNSRTIPPPASHLPTATVAPTHATYLPPNPTALTRDPYYMGPDKYAGMKYDKYAGVSYQQTYVSPPASRHNMWPNTPHASNLTQLNERHLLSSGPPVPPTHGLHTTPYFPGNTNSSLNSRQSCCSQPYQPQNCYYPPSHAVAPRLPHNQSPTAPSAAGGYLSAQPSIGQSPHLNALTASCKYGGLMPDYGNGSKTKTSNDLYHYDNNSLPHNYGYGSAHSNGSSSQQLYASNAHVQPIGHSLTPSSLLTHDPLNANPASYNNDLSLATSNFDNYHTHLEPHLSPQTLAGIHGQQPPPPAYGPTVAKRALLDYRKPIQPQPPPTLNEECYTTLTTTRDHYNQQELLNTPETTTTFGEYETGQQDNNTYTHQTENMGDTDKTNDEGNKNLSLRDFIANWNDDEDEYQNTEEINFGQTTVIEDVLQTAPVEQQEKVIIEETVIIKEVNTEDLKTKKEEVKKQKEENLSPTSLNITDVNQYVNLPDIVIDIEKSNNVNNNSITTPATSPTPPTTTLAQNTGDAAAPLNLNNFDVEKELDELKLKKPKQQELTKDLSDIKETQNVNTPKLSPCKNLTTQLSFEDLNLESTNKTVLTQTQSSELNEQYFKDMEGYESGNSRHSNESAFEKEYETFINKITSETSAEKTSEEQTKLEMDKDLDFEQNVQDFSKFYKRKRKLKEDELKTNEPEIQTQKKLKTNETTKVNNSNFPQVYTKKSRNRLHQYKQQCSRKRKPLSAYYKIIHSIRRLGWYRLKRVREYMTELKEKHLPLIKRQSIKNYTHDITPNLYNVKSLKALCIMAINTEEFRENLMLTFRGVADNCPEETEEKHICTDPTCETCEVIRSLMEAESFEATIMQQAGDSTLETPDVQPTILCIEGNQETITIIENVENINDLNFQLEEPKTISNVIENVQYAKEITNEFHVKEGMENFLNLEDTKSKLNENSEILFDQAGIITNKCDTEFDLKNWYEKDLQNKESADIMQQPISELTTNSKDKIRSNGNENLNTEEEGLKQLINQDELNDSTQKVAIDLENVAQTKLSDEQISNSNENLETCENPKILQEVPTLSPKLTDISSKIPTRDNDKIESANSEKSSTTKNTESESENSESSESDSESSSSSSSSSSDDESVGNSKDSIKKSKKSDDSSGTDTESDLENDDKGNNTDTSKSYHSENSLVQNIKTKELLKPKINESEINNRKRKSRKIRPNKMDVDSNTDSDDSEPIPKSPQRIVIRLKKSIQFSPSQNFSKERASYETDNYYGSDSEDDKFSENHFEVISTTLKLKPKEKAFMKNTETKKAQVSDNRTESESEADDISDKKSENIRTPLSPKQERTTDDHKSEKSLESHTESEFENEEILEKKPEISPKSMQLSPKQQSSTENRKFETTLEALTDNEVHNEEILEKNLEEAFQSSPDSPTKFNSKTESDFEDNALTEKNSTSLNLSPTLKEVPEDNLSEKSIESHSESESDGEDIVEKTHLKLTSTQTDSKEKALEKSPELNSKFDHQSESEYEDDNISGKNSNLNSTPLKMSPKSESFKENHKSESIVESDTSSESEDDEMVEKPSQIDPIQEEEKLAFAKTPKTMSESENLKGRPFEDFDISQKGHEMIPSPSNSTPIQEDSIEGHSSEKSCEPSIELENQTKAESALNETVEKDLSLIENTSKSDSVTEECLTVKYTLETSEDTSEDEEKIPKEIIEICQKPNKIEEEAPEIIEIYNLTESEDDEEEIEEELSLKLVPLKEDCNKSLLSDSASSSSDSEYESDDEEETNEPIKKLNDSKPIEISDDESMDSMEKLKDHIPKFKSKTEMIDSNVIKKSEIKEIDDVFILKNMVELEQPEDLKLTVQTKKDKEVSAIISHNPNEDLSLDSESSKEEESTIIESKIEIPATDSNEIKNTQVSNKESNCEEIILDLSSSSDESDDEMDDILNTDRKNIIEDKLSMISESLLNSPPVQELTNPKEIMQCSEENSEISECNSKADKPKTPVNNLQESEETIKDLITFQDNNQTSDILTAKNVQMEAETKISETISEGLSDNLDVEQSYLNNESVNNSNGFENQGKNGIIAESNAEISNVLDTNCSNTVDNQEENIEQIEAIPNTPDDKESQADNNKHVETIHNTPEVKELTILEDDNNPALKFCKEILNKELISAELIADKYVIITEAFKEKPSIINDTKEYMTEDILESLTEESSTLEEPHSETPKSEEKYDENKFINKSITENCEHVSKPKIKESENASGNIDDSETIVDSFNEKCETISELAIENSDITENINNETSQVSEKIFDQQEIDSQSTSERQEIIPETVTEDSEDFEKVNSRERFEISPNEMENSDFKGSENVAKVIIQESAKDSETIDDSDIDMENTKKQELENSEDLSNQMNESKSNSKANADKSIEATKSKQLESFEELSSEKDTEFSASISDETIELVSANADKSNETTKSKHLESFEELSSEKETEFSPSISDATIELVEEGDTQTSSILRDNLNQTDEENELPTFTSVAITKTSEPEEEGDTQTSPILRDNLGQTEEKNELPALISEELNETSEPEEEGDTQTSSKLKDNLDQTEEDNELPKTSELVEGDTHTPSMLEDDLNQTEEDTELSASILNELTEVFEPEEEDFQTSAIVEENLNQTVEEAELPASISEELTETSETEKVGVIKTSAIVEDSLNQSEELTELPASISNELTETSEREELNIKNSEIIEDSEPEEMGDNKTSEIIEDYSNQSIDSETNVKDSDILKEFVKENSTELPVSNSDEVTEKSEPEEVGDIKTAAIIEDNTSQSFNSEIVVEDSDILKEFEKENSKNSEEIFDEEDARKSSTVLESSASDKLETEHKPITFESLEESLSENAENVERSLEITESLENDEIENFESYTESEKTQNLKPNNAEASQSYEEESGFKHPQQFKVEDVIEEPNCLVEDKNKSFEISEEESGLIHPTLSESEEVIKKLNSLTEEPNEISHCNEEKSELDHQILSEWQPASESPSALKENKIEAAEIDQQESIEEQPTSSKFNELVTIQSPSHEEPSVDIQTEISELSINSSSIHNILDKDSVSQGDLSEDFLGFKNQSSFEDESGDFHGFEDLEEVTRIRQEIENLNEDSAANDGFLSYNSLNRDSHKTSTTSLTGSTSSEINELEALEKELSQHQTEMPVEDDEDKETDKDLLTECNTTVSTNDIEHIKQMLESDEEPQTEDPLNNEDSVREKAEEAENEKQELKDKFVENSKTNLNNIISSNISIIPKLSDLCRAALNSSLNSNSNLTQQHNTETSTHIVERELSVEEALAEMYRRAGVLSDPEDYCDTDNIHATGDTDDEAHDVLLFNLQEILNSDNNDVYVLQCDMNENILNVMQTNDEDQQQQQEDHQQQQQQDDNVNNTERVNRVQFIGILDTHNAEEPQIHIISSDSESEVIILSDDDSDFSYRPFISTHERITIPFINDHELNDSDSLSDISTIHHEEIVPDNLNKFLQEEFYKYLHEKYVQRNISKYYHANRVLKKYKKRFIKTKRQ